MHPPPKLESGEQAQRLADFLRSANYSEEGVKEVLRENQDYLRKLRTPPRLLYRTSEPNLTNLLIRWFHLGVDVDGGVAARAVPLSSLELMTETGLLVQAGEELRPTVKIEFWDDHLVCSEVQALFERSLDPRIVFHIDGSTRLLDRFLIKEHAHAAFDVGCGGGVLSMRAAAFCDQVFGSDVNPRAIEFARFNARLNGLDKKIEFQQGDCFSAAGDRQFPLVFSNPPFLVTPPAEETYRENRVELDGFCQRLVREAPRHLSPGGFFQVIAEWVEVAGEGWKDRLRGWFDGLSCNALVLLRYSVEPPEYAQGRFYDCDWANPQRDEEVYRRLSDYYRKNEVKRILGGFIALQKTDAPQWVHFSETNLNLSQPVGGAVAQVFSSLGALHRAAHPEAALSLRPVVAPGARLRRRQVFRDSQWLVSNEEFFRPDGFCEPSRFRREVVGLTTLCNGQRTIREIASELAHHTGAPADQMVPECLKVIRELVLNGILIIPTED